MWVWVGSGFSFSGFSVVSGFLGFWLYYTPAGRTTTCHSTAHTLVTDAYVRKTLESGASWQPTPAGGCAFGRPLQRGAHSSTHIQCMLSVWVGATEPGNCCIFCAHLLITWLCILAGDSTIGRPKQLGHSWRPCGYSHMGDIGDSTPLLFLPCLIQLRDSTRGGVGGVEHSLGCVTAYDTTAVAA